METQQPEGLTLKLERVTRGVKAKAIAEAMGVSATRLSHIEGSTFVTAETRDRYLRALTTCATSRTLADA